MKIKLILDNEIYLNEETDLLGTLPYVDIVCNIINNNEGKLTVGIFGAWGSGKSSIVKSVIQKFESKQERFFPFYYDTWKFNDDSFKRNFILKLVDKLNLDKNYFREKLYNSYESEEVIGADASHDWLIKLLIWSPIFLLLVAFIDLFLENVVQNGKAIVAAIAIIVTIFMNIIKDVLKKEKKRKKIYPIDSPEQFEELFNEIFEKCITFDKIIIFIDNVDRCNPEKAKEVLESVKNFLEHPKIIYVIPIDDNSLQQHLEMDDFVFNEFQRKIFNSSLTIRPFSSNELLFFAHQLNEKYDLNLPMDVLDICTSIYSKNPRRVINFLNKIQIEKSLVELQEDKKNFIKGKLSQNISGLAKLLAIKEEWTDLYDKIEKDIDFLKKIEEEATRKDADFIFAGIQVDYQKRYFLKRNADVSTEGFEYFFLNKFTLDRKEDSIEKFILNKKYEPIIKLLSLGRFDIKELLTELKKLIIEMEVSEKSKNQFLIYQFIIYLLSRKDFIQTSLSEISNHKEIEELVLSETKLSNYLPYLDKDDLIEAILNLGNNALSKEPHKILTVLLRQISNHTLNNETESHLEGIRNELYIFFNSNDIKHKKSFEKHLFNNINTATNSVNINLDQIDSLYFFISEHSKNQRLLKKLTAKKKENFEGTDFIEVLESENLTIDETVSLLRIFAFSLNYSSTETMYSKLKVIHILLDTYIKFDLKQSSHEVHHIPIINLFKEILNYLKKVDNNEKIYSFFPPQLKEIINEFSEIDYCDELKKIQKELSKETNSISGPLDG